MIHLRQIAAYRRAATLAIATGLAQALAVMPITGISTLVGNGFGLTVFGATPIPGGEHIGAALYHYAIKQDGVMQRML